MKIKISEEISDRLDVYLTKELIETRSNIANNINSGNILVNDKIVKCGYKLRIGDIIDVNLQDKITSVIPENIKLDIYYEDDDIIVVNKPSGMVVHPGAGNKSGTLVNALMYYTKGKLSDINGEVRPGIVHRIDKDTSGLLLVSKTNEAHRILSDDFKNKRIKRKYIALVEGVINENSGKIDAPIGRNENDRIKMAVRENGKKAVTNFKVIERYKNSTLLECILETGRTHQIRVHMAYINHPVINDPLYGKSFDEYGQMLHAGYIGFVHPIKKEFMEFSSPLEKRFLEILDSFKNSWSIYLNLL